MKSPIFVRTLSKEEREAFTAPPNNVVVTLSAPDASGFSSGCTTVERDLALDFLRNPEDYYVNAHNDSFPIGAVRGQLSYSPSIGAGGNRPKGALPSAVQR